MLFVIGWLMLSIAAIFLSLARIALLLYGGVYLGVLGLGAMQVGRRTCPRGFILAPVVFMILHFGYGLGCLSGVVKFVFLKRGRISHQMSR